MNHVSPGILFIVNSLRFGGAEKHVVSLLNHLDVSRFRLSLAYLKREETLLSQLNAERLQTVFCCDVSKKIDFTAARNLANLIDENEIDIVVCTNTYSMFYGFLARKFAKRPFKIIEVFHTTLLQTVKNRLQMFFYRPFFKKADLLVYVCENQRSYWRNQGLRAKTDKVIYNGVDMDYFVDCYTPEEKLALRTRFGFRSEDYVVGICAALRPEKAHGDLLDALKKLHNQGIPAKCLIIGDGPERMKIETRIAELGLQGQVGITGFQEDVRPFISACDVMALVSHSETFSISALESMALGKPMIMSRVGGAEEQVETGWNGVVFSPGDIDELVNSMASLANKQTLSISSARARERVVDRFSLSVMIQGYESVLHTMVSDSR